MGAERVGDRLFVALPRRRYGIPATLNYIDLRDTSRSPALRPYPSLRASRSLVSTPAIVVFDLRTDRQIMRYELKEADVPANNTPTDAFAYIPDLTTFGIVVYSLRDNDSWRVTHNYLHFNPSAVNLHISALAPGSGCRTAYFHPLISTQEFSVSTCTLNNRTAHLDPDYWTRYSIVGERGSNSQSTMHDLHSSGVMFYADIGADGVACWNTRRPLDSATFSMLASDQKLMSYPADLHVTGDEVWVIFNTLP
ncbi:Yellow 2, partial [Operophtera brumata]